MSELNNMIVAALENTKLPFTYRLYKAKEIKPPPFITYYFEREHHSGPDGYNAVYETTVVIELYTVVKDFELEALIESELSENEFDKTEEYNEADEVFRITYEFKIKLKKERA